MDRPIFIKEESVADFLREHLIDPPRELLEGRGGGGEKYALNFLNRTMLIRHKLKLGDRVSFRVEDQTSFTRLLVVITLDYTVESFDDHSYKLSFQKLEVDGFDFTDRSPWKSNIKPRSLCMIERKEN